MKGRSTVNRIGSGDADSNCTTMAVAAAASMPSWSTAMKASWMTARMKSRASSVIAEKSACPSQAGNSATVYLGQRGDAGAAVPGSAKRPLGRRLIVPSHIFAVIYDPLVCRFEPRSVRHARGKLVGDLNGEILEVGAGTGAPFDNYGVGARITATDHNPHMGKRA